MSLPLRLFLDEVAEPLKQGYHHHLAGLRKRTIITGAVATAFHGLYRTNAWAYVTNGTMAFQVPEAEYRALGYEPNYDNLPWKESYDVVQVREEPRG